MRVLIFDKSTNKLLSKSDRYHEILANYLFNDPIAKRNPYQSLKKEKEKPNPADAF